MFLAAVLLVGMSIPAFAAVENVKVGGDITIRGIYRTNYDFTKNSSQAQAAMDNVDYLMTTTRIYVTSELTDNVAVVVRLINERDWGADNLIADTFLFNVGGVDYFLREKRSGSNIDLDLAYIKLSDMFAPGLSATIGRQEILLGKGLVVGNANPWGTETIRDYMEDPTTAIWEVETPIRAWDYNARKAFDAVRLDYALSVIPLTLTGAVAKIDEQYATISIGGDTNGDGILDPGEVWDGSRDTGLDQDLYLINANYQVPVADAEVEGYFVRLANARGTKDSVNELVLNTFGIRGAHNVAAVPGLSYKGEAAFQSGDIATLKAKGYTLDAGVGYAFQGIAWEPKLGLNYSYYTGDDDWTNTSYDAWIPLFPDGLADKVGAIGYGSGLAPLVWLAGSGLQIVKLSGSIQPIEKLNVSLAWFNDSLVKTAAGVKKELGDEINLGLNYAYSEDVAMGLLFGYYSKGALIKQFLGANATDAMQLVGTVAVSF